MFKHTQTVRRKIADELFERVWSFCGIGTEKVKELFEDLVNSPEY